MVRNLPERANEEKGYLVGAAANGTFAALGRSRSYCLSSVAVAALCDASILHSHFSLGFAYSAKAPSVCQQKIEMADFGIKFAGKTS
jgi:hypothetical protein